MKMLSINNLKDLKTTFIGIMFLISGFSYIFLKEDVDIWIAILLFLFGIGFLFLPDTVLDGLKMLVNKNKNKKI